MELLKKLEIKMASDTRKMSGCPKYTQDNCGIMYRGS